jgi:hypothetical protein
LIKKSRIVKENSMRLPIFWSADANRWSAALWELPRIELEAEFAGGYFFLREPSDSFNGAELLGDTSYLVSPDAQSWDRIEVSDSEWFGLPVHGHGVWLAGGGQGKVATSTNAVDWQIISTTSTNELRHAAFLAGTFFLTGTQGAMLTSADGSSWSAGELDSTNMLGKVTWHDGLFAVAEEETTRLHISTDGVAWTAISMPANVGLIESLIGWQEGFLALVRSSAWEPAFLLRSTDGRSWFEVTLPSETVGRIAVGADRLLAFRGIGSRTFHSRRAGETDWSTHLLPWSTSSGSWIFYTAPSGVAFGNDTFLLTHGAEYVIQSDPLTDSAPRITQSLVAAAVPDATRVTLRAVVQGSTPLRHQWRMDGTNLPSATTPFLTLDVQDLQRGRVTVYVENDFGSAESEAATLGWVEPATLELASRLNTLRLRGTPRAPYEVETTVDPAVSSGWTMVGIATVPSSGGPVTLKNLRNPYLPLPGGGYYRAVAQP